MSELVMNESGFQLAMHQASLYEGQSAVFMAPSANLMVDAMDLQRGDQVLDLACGTGLVARAARRVVGTDGRVVGADLNPAMLAVANSIEPEIEWLQAPADRLPLDDEAFTHVACQQGFQFFPHASAAAAEAFRVLRPHGRLVATVWATPGHNPYIETQLAILAELDATVAESARTATPVKADEMMVGVASDAGFTEINVSLLEHTVEVADVEAFFLSQTASTPWAPVIAMFTADELQILAGMFAARLKAPGAASGGYLLRFASHMLIARKEPFDELS
ncbi:MAG: methyltransferase domain-containing protein [Acidimicrobiales bacterium]|nr:methyltransferase domain-containing protein [Acidimicrobiales bacterium]